MPSRFLKPCLVCQKLSPGRLCETHLAVEKAAHEARRKEIKKVTKQYSGSYAKRAKEIRDTATTCHLCHEGFRINDPFEADHINPSEDGNTAILLPAHRSCNRKRSNKPL